jgi:hypothetical protein
LTSLCAGRTRRGMGFLIKIAIFAFVAWGIWKTANRWFNFLGGNRPPAPPRQAPPPPAPPPQAARDRVQTRPGMVEDTHPCAVCGAFVAAGAAKCDRPDCPQPQARSA